MDLLYSCPAPRLVLFFLGTFRTMNYRYVQIEVYMICVLSFFREGHQSATAGTRLGQHSTDM